MKDPRGKSTVEIDIYVGLRMRERRTVLGLTLQQFADSIGVTYQQAHKYERGINRVSAGRLFNIAQILSVQIGYFYEGLDEEQEQNSARPSHRMMLELSRNFALITDERHQAALTQLARALANGKD